MVSRVFAHEWIVTLRCIGGVARPPVIGRRCHHSCAYGVQFDVSVAPQQVRFAVHEAGFVAPLPKYAGPAVAIIDEADIAPAKSLHDSSDMSAAGWCREQVDVIGHQHVGVHRAFFLGADLPQVVEVAQPVDVGKEARLPIISPSE